MGEIISIAFALIMHVGFLGMIFILVISRILDKSYTRKITWFFSQRDRQEIFFSTTFETMGHLIKSKGRVTDIDIQIVNQLMDRMNLQGQSRILAINAFRLGKAESYPLREKLRQIRNICFGRIDLTKMFLEVQIQSVFSNALLHPNQLRVLYIVAEELSISRVQFNQFLQMIKENTQFNNDYQKQPNNRWKRSQRNSNLDNPFDILGVQPTDDIVTIKRAYRKLMSEYHPDKLIAKGLSKDMMEMAKQKAQKIQKAYELIKEKKKVS